MATPPPHYVPLPSRDGVGASVIVLPNAEKWQSLLDFLTARFSTISRDEIIERMQRGDVCDANGNTLLPSTPYISGQKLYYYRAIPNEARVPFEAHIVFEDDLIVVADKPHFLPVTPGGRFLQETLLVRLKRTLGIDTLAPMHRIDRETAGLVAFTKRPETRGAYQRLFQMRTVTKHYLAVANDSTAFDNQSTYRSRIVESAHFMRMQETPGAPNAEMKIKCLRHLDGRALYQLTPLTGKKHQLRIQMAAMGLPIENDQIYPVHAKIDEEDYTKPLQLLAYSLAFLDPITGCERDFVSSRALNISMLPHTKVDRCALN